MDKIKKVSDRVGGSVLAADCGS